MQYIKQVNSTGCFDLRLDLGDVDLPHMDQVSKYLVFPIKTYMKVSSRGSKEANWGINFGVVNQFFDQCPMSIRKPLAQTLVTLHHKIVQFMQTRSIDELDDLRTDLSKLLMELDQSVSLYPEIIRFCENNLTFGNTKDAGKKAEHSASLTFGLMEIKHLTGIVVLSKLLSPIFGTLMYYLKDQAGVDGKVKELHSVALVKELLDFRDGPLVAKLLNYIKHFISKDYTEDMTNISHGITLNSLVSKIFATIVVRNFANVDLHLPDGNLMTYIKVIIKITTRNNTHHTARVMLRGDNRRAEDESNRAQLESDSVISSKTADTPLIISSVIDRIVSSRLVEFDLCPELYTHSVQWFVSHPVTIHALNRLAIQVYFAKDLEGAKSLEYLNAGDVACLIALMQQLCVTTLGYAELGHLLSTSVGTLARSTQTNDDAMLRVNYKTSTEYRQCKALFTEGAIVNNKHVARQFDKTMAAMVEKMTTMSFLFNAAPEMWEAQDHDPLNGQSMRFSADIIKQYCAFVEIFSTK